VTLVSKAFTTNLGAFLRATGPFFACVRLNFKQGWLRLSMGGVPKVFRPPQLSYYLLSFTFASARSAVGPGKKKGTEVP